MPYGNLNVDTVTTSTSGGVLGAGNASIMKNRCINGDMRIDQRNAGASVGTGSTSYFSIYSLDRWSLSCSATNKFTAQQSSTAPTGFVNSLLATSSSAYSIGAGDYFTIGQRIEGYNVADLNWGTANAKTITLSFQVYSSLTGTFGGALSNGANNRSYPFTYTVSSANTWTTVSVTISGDTSGTWITTNGNGLQLTFGLGVGSTYSGTAGAWAGALLMSATGATSVVGTRGATWYATGFQLEVGSSATGFEYRQYGQELQLCQRYYQFIGGVATGFPIVQAYQSASTNFSMPMSFAVTMRTTPTATVLGTWSVSNSSQPSAAFLSPYGASLRGIATALGACYFYPTGTTEQITFSAEL
jgi:hypothetical protein